MECSPSEYIAWERRFEFFIADQDLRHTISPDAPEIAVISCTNNAYLFGQFGEELVLEHRQVWGYISEATADAPFEDRLYECHSISDALRIMRELSLPLYPVERHLLVAELERVRFMGDEESEIVQFILRQFPEPETPVVVVYSPAHLGDQREGMGTGAAARQGPGGQGASTSVNDYLIRLHYSTRSPPKMPNDPAKTLSWICRFDFFGGSENLTHILTTIPSTGPVDVISCNDRFFLKRIHGVQTVGDNWKVWQYLLEAACNTDIEEKLAACNSVHEAWGVVTNGRCLRLRQRKPSFPNNWRTLKCTPTKTPKRSLYASTSS